MAVTLSKKKIVNRVASRYNARIELNSQIEEAIGIHGYRHLLKNDLNELRRVMQFDFTTD